MFNFTIHYFTVYLTLKVQLVVFEAECSFLRHDSLVIFIENLEQYLLLLKRIACTLCEFSEGDEVIRVDTVESLDLRCECAEVRHEGLYFHLATELGLSFIYGEQGDLSIFVSPEAAPSRFHVSSGECNTQQIKE